MRKYFPYIIFISALLISIVAEFFSIFGISKLFSGAELAAIVLAISLGLAKIVAVSSIQMYWDRLGKSKFGQSIRIYLSIATVILMIITSIGVYGFLASAYQFTANADKLVQTKIELMKVKKDRFDNQKIELSGESKSLAVSLENLRKSLSTDNQYQYIDKRSGQVLTQIQSTSKKGVQDQIDKISAQKELIDIKIDRISDSINQYDYRILETESNSNSTSELGPLKYLAGLTGYSMDRIINWLMLLLVIVIDPLAISLVMVAQFAFKNDRWVRGLLTRQKNQNRKQKPATNRKRKQPKKSPTNDDLDSGDTLVPESIESVSEANVDANRGISRRTGKPKRKYVRKQIVANSEKTERTIVDTPVIDLEKKS